MTDHQPVIVGIDPGTTTAVAILDHTGTPIATTSDKHRGRSGITRYIIDHGTPVLVAADVTPAPDTVSKLAATFGVTAWTPDSDLDTAIKDQIATSLDVTPDDDHVRDALAAAVKAYQAHRSTITEAQQKAKAADTAVPPTALIDTAINDPAALHSLLTADDTESEGYSGPKEETDWKQVAQRHIKRARKKQETIERLRAYIDDLKQDRDQLEEKVSELEEQQEQDITATDQYQQLQEHKRSLQSRKDKLANRNSELEEQCNRYCEAVGDVVRDDRILVPVIDSPEEIPPAVETVGVDGVLQNDLPPQVQTVIADDNAVSTFANRGYDVIRREEIDCIRFGDILAVTRDSMTPVKDDETKFTEWLDSYRERHE